MTTKDDAMQSSFTPGPWAFAKYSAKRFGLGQKGNGAFFFLQCVNDSADDPQARADARLIAAAPDLLEALRRIEEYWNQDQNETAMADACWHAINTARAAIAKATGENT